MTTSSDLRRHGNALLLALALLAAPSLASADPSASDMQSARDLFKQGEALRAAGDDKGALDKLRAAHALAHTPITGVELGATYEKLGLLVEAREVWLEVGRIPTSKSDSASTQRARNDAKTREATLAARIPTLAISVDAGANATAEVSVDGAAIPAATLGQPRSLDPGKHSVVARTVAGAMQTLDVTLKEGEHAQVSLKPALPAALAAPPPASTPAPAGPAHPAAAQPAPAPPDSPDRTVMWVGFGLAGAGVLVGAVTGVLAFSKKGTVDGECPDKRCPSAAQSDIDASKRFGTVSTVAFAAAGVGAVVGTVALLVSRGKASSSTSGRTQLPAAPWLTLSARGLGGAF